LISLKILRKTNIIIVPRLFLDFMGQKNYLWGGNGLNIDFDLALRYECDLFIFS